MIATVEEDQMVQLIEEFQLLRRQPQSVSKLLFIVLSTRVSTRVSSTVVEVPIHKKVGYLYPCAMAHGVII